MLVVMQSHRGISPMEKLKADGLTTMTKERALGVLHHQLRAMFLLQKMPKSESMLIAVTLQCGHWMSAVSLTNSCPPLRINFILYLLLKGPIWISSL